MNKTLLLALITTFAPAAETTEIVKITDIKRLPPTIDGLAPNGHSVRPSISGDGTRVVFTSSASNFVEDDKPGSNDAFLYDRITGEVTLLNRDKNGKPAGGANQPAFISADGSHVVFSSNGQLGTNPISTNRESQVYVYEVATDTLRILSVTSDGQPGDEDSENPHINADGSLVAFQSRAKNLQAPNVERGIYAVPSSGGTLEHLSIAPDGSPIDDWCILYCHLMDDSGRFVPFSPNELGGVYIRDRVTQTTIIASETADGVKGDGYVGVMSPDGKRCAFMTSSPTLLGLPAETKSPSQIAVKDLTTGKLTIVSRNSRNEFANDHCQMPVFSRTNNLLFYQSYANNLIPGIVPPTEHFKNHRGEKVEEDGAHAYRIDLTSNKLQCLTLEANGQPADAGTYVPMLSNDGSSVVFHSRSTNLVVGDNNNTVNIYVIDQVPALEN